MPRFRIDDVTIHYREAGVGPLLLVLPGNTASSANHSGELAYFSDRFHVVSPDLRGSGQSTRLDVWPDDWYARCAHDVAALVQHLGTDRCVAMGTSGGAIVALWLAILHPARVTGVVADSTASGYPPAWLRQAMATRSERSPGQVAFWQGAHGDDWAQVVEQDTAMLLRIADRGGDFFNGRLTEVRCPALLTASTADSVLYDVGPAQLAMAAAIPDSRLFLAKQGDHPLMWSNPDEFRCVADAFLSHFPSA